MQDMDTWNTLKKQLAARAHVPPSAEGEIWWCSIGINIGSEVYGKGPRFTRPVLILKKLKYSAFIGIPMSSKLKLRHDYYILNFKGKDSALMLGEIRKFDSRRLADKIGKLSEEKLKRVVKAALENIQPRTV